MPKLKDSELRVMLVLLRQTLGFNRDRAKVVLPYSVLTKSTGRGTEAIARALTSLKAKGLIHTKQRRKRKNQGNTEDC